MPRDESVESEAPVAARMPDVDRHPTSRSSASAEAAASTGGPVSYPMTDSAFALRGLPKIGEIVGGHYRLDGVLGRGGMSVVYRATHLELEQEVALKVLSAAALVIPQYVTRLKHEARAAARIHSPHVVRVQDAGELTPGGVPFLVMELLEGADLGAVLQREGPLPVAFAIECILQAIDAVGAAHRVGIVHRDLKPGNLFLTTGDRGAPCIKVLDFGISRMFTRPALSPLTDPGIALGTPHYMSPEQMEASEKVDARSDIFALGAILHQLVAGEPPFPGTALPQIYMKIMRSPPPRLSTLRADVPRELDVVVRRCLSANPDERFASVVALAAALRAVPLAPTSRVVVPPSLTEQVASQRSITLASANVAAAPPPSSRVARGSTLGSSVGALVLGGVLTLGALAIPKALGVVVDEPRGDDAPNSAEPSARHVLADGIPALSLPTVRRPAAVEVRSPAALPDSTRDHDDATIASDGGAPRTSPPPESGIRSLSPSGPPEAASATVTSADTGTKIGDPNVAGVR